MNWKTKARIQNVIAALPSTMSYAAYYWIQRHFGGLKKLDHVSKLKAGFETWQRIQSLGYDPSEKMFFEIGTGRAPVVPIAYWLMGAKGTFTIDLNPYLKDELVQESVDCILENKDTIKDLLFPFLDQNRFSELAKLRNSANAGMKTILELCQITYIAPGDATKTDLDDESIDFHTSYTVLEHIPPDVLREILREGNRITKGKGLFVHRIDYSDHFSHSDRKISAINFLQYSDSEWSRYAGTRYMYMNRLRHDDFLELFESSGHRILINEPDRDARSFDLLRSDTFPLSDKFKGKSKEVLAISSAWLVTQKKIASKQAAVTD